MRTYGEQPNRLLCPWNSPGKNIGVGCHFVLRFQTTHAANTELALWNKCLSILRPPCREHSLELLFPIWTTLSATIETINKIWNKFVAITETAQ